MESSINDPPLILARLQAVDLLLEGSPHPVTRITFDRLLKEGYPEIQAKAFIGAVYALGFDEMFKSRMPFDFKKYEEHLNRLPILPDEW